ncbi:MAG: hypothetical protein AAGF31_03650 [Planctomycetota bacterium]
MLENAHLGRWNICCSNKAFAWEAGLLAYHQSSQGRKPLFSAVPLYGPKEIADARTHNAGETSHDIVREDLTIRSG